MDSQLPKHIAIIMDGNGRWAKQRRLPRLMGHRAGVEATRNIVTACRTKGIQALTLFAFSSENWQRPMAEVTHLFDLFLTTLGKEIESLHENNVRFKVIGDIAPFSQRLQAQIQAAEQLTRANTGLLLNIAVNYGGRWDIVQSCRAIAEKVQLGHLSLNDISERLVQQHLATAELPEPDLFIRTSGEQRISNFLIWQLSYTELYFTELHWPDFDDDALDKALDHYRQRQRRFGLIGEQLEADDIA